MVEKKEQELYTRTEIAEMYGMARKMLTVAQERLETIPQLALKMTDITRLVELSDGIRGRAKTLDDDMRARARVKTSIREAKLIDMTKLTNNELILLDDLLAKASGERTSKYDVVASMASMIRMEDPGEDPGANPVEDPAEDPDLEQV